MITITCLAENTAVNDTVGAEHGLSLWIETPSRRVLMDMGQTSLFANNAAVCGLALADVDTAIVSHGHYDHGGGLYTFLQANDHAPVYISRFAFEPHFNGDKYIGLDTRLQGHPRLHVTDGIHPLGDGLTLFADALSVGTLTNGSAGLSAEHNGVRVPDDFRHEQYLLIEDDGRRILISGCSHRGILEIAKHFRPDVLIGGFHLSKLDPQEAVAAYAQPLSDSGAVYYTCHCTGVEQFEAMATAMPHLHYLAGGQTICI